MDPFCLTPWLSRYGVGVDTPLSPDPIWIDQVVVDSRAVHVDDHQKQCLFVALKGQHVDGHAYIRDAVDRGAKYAIVQKGFCLPASLPKQITCFYVEEPLRALQQIAMLYRQTKSAKIIAVTGSRGKTLMKDLLVHLLAPLGEIYGSPESFNSQVGVALSLLRIRSRHTIAVLEAGISKIGEMLHLAKMLQPDIALLLNLIPQLGQALETVEAIAQEKIQLPLSVMPHGALFLPPLPALQRYHPQLEGRVHTWGSTADIHVQPTEYPGNYVVTLPGIQEGYSIHLPARFWAELLKQALEVAYHLGVTSQQLTERLSAYTPESMETHVWRSTQGVTLINSPYCADPQSIASTVRYLKQTPPGAKRFFFLHGVRPPYHPESTLAYLKHMVDRKEVDTVVVCGLGEENMEGVIHVPDVHEGLKWLATHARHGDHIACKGSHQLLLEAFTHAFQDRTPYNICRIDLTRVAHNIACMRKKMPQGTQLMVMVKALAYGTESVRIAHFLSECGIAFLGVSFVDEGVALKQAGVTQTIFSLYVAPQEVEKAIAFGLHVGVDSLSMLHALEEEAVRQDRCVHVHLHVDTGMRRLGCRPQDALQLAHAIANLPHLHFEGLFTHFVAADMPEEDAFTEAQFRTINSLYQTMKEQGIAPAYMHMGNSASLVRLPHLMGNMVRIGLALYGLYHEEAEEGFLEALSLHSRIIALHDCPKGESVGYGRHYRALKDEKIAVVPLGYFDGIARQWSGKVSLQVRGRRVPIVGVCMDYLMLDVTSLPNVQIGDPVLIFGEDGHGGRQSFKQLAQEGGEIIHALLAQMGSRISRIFSWNA